LINIAVTIDKVIIDRDQAPFIAASKDLVDDLAALLNL
jgi:hypothetical protein